VRVATGPAERVERGRIAVGVGHDAQREAVFVGEATVEGEIGG